jgi:hypothetical protein
MNIKTIIGDFFYPRFSTAEIESSKLKCNLEFEATGFYYDDEKRGFPTHILGYIKTRKGHLLHASYNKYGECTIKGKRIKSFDLVRPSQKEIDAASSIVTSLFIGVIVITVCAIF